MQQQRHLYLHPLPPTTRPPKGFSSNLMSPRHVLRAGVSQVRPEPHDADTVSSPTSGDSVMSAPHGMLFACIAGHKNVMSFFRRLSQVYIISPTLGRLPDGENLRGGSHAEEIC